MFLGHDEQLDCVTINGGEAGLLAEGRLPGGGLVWVIYSYMPAEPLPVLKLPPGTNLPAAALVGAEVGNLRGNAMNVEPDGSLKFIDVRIDASARPL